MNLKYKISKLQNIFNSYLSNILKNKNALIIKILEVRNKAAIMIQKFYRKYAIQTEIIAYRERGKNFYQISYSGVWEDTTSESESSQERSSKMRKNSINNNNEDIYLEILYPKTEQNKYHLQFCKFTNMNIAYIPKEKFLFSNKGINNVKKIYFKFKEGNKDCIDPNYEIILLDKKEMKYCNMIDLNTIDNFDKVTQSILHKRKKLYDYSNWQLEKNIFKGLRKFLKQDEKDISSANSRKGRKEFSLDRSCSVSSQKNSNEGCIKRKFEKYHRIKKHLKKFICNKGNNFCNIYNINFSPQSNISTYKSEENFSNISDTPSFGLLETKNLKNFENYEDDYELNSQPNRHFLRRIYSKSK
jgi:hypothetical protein